MRAGGSIKGRVVDALTSKGTQADIMRTVRDDATGQQVVTFADADGSFIVQGLAAGVYDLGVRGASGGVCVLRGVVVQAGTETSGLLLRLSPGGRVRVRNASKDGFLIYRVVSEGVVIASDGVGAGGASETTAPVGKVMIEVEWPPTKVESKEVNISVDEVMDVVFGNP